MNSLLVRRYLPAALLGVGVALVASSRAQAPVPLARSLTTVVPAFGDFRVTEQKVSDDERKVAGMSDYVARAFWHDTTVAFTTYVGYYDQQRQGKTIHSPRNCMPGAGWEILATDTTSLMLAGTRHVVNKFMLKNGPYQAVVLYWYQGRGRVVASEYAVKWNLLRDAAFEGHTEEALVRIVAFVPPASLADSAKSLTAVADAERLALSVGAKLISDVQTVLPVSNAAPVHTASVGRVQ